MTNNKEVRVKVSGAFIFYAAKFGIHNIPFSKPKRKKLKKK